jgi:hypothetical protein
LHLTHHLQLNFWLSLVAVAVVAKRRVAVERVVIAQLLELLAVAVVQNQS